ncbi:MAG: threonine ammonia-lyase, biosynthetic [Pseudomonadota bacterium]
MTQTKTLTRFAAPTTKLLADLKRRIDGARVYDVAVVTPLQTAAKLSARLGNTVLLKREDLQPVHSFKLRGAFNKIISLTPAERAKGVICASAGNHAQGVALAGKHLGIATLICMPRTTPAIKVDSVRALGGKVVLHGDAYDDAREHAEKLAAEKGLTFVHPYDDIDVIAGQGTVAKEMLEQLQGQILDAVFVCVGGGGLLAGVASYIKAVSPRTRVIAVEPDDSDCFARAFEAGRRVELKTVGLFADGVAVKQVGVEPWRVARRLVDEVIRVDADEICAAIRDCFSENRSVPEPAGALAVAGLKKWVALHEAKGLTLAATVSGANVNFDRLRHIAERAEIGDHTEALLAVTIPEKPGSFRRFLKQLGKRVITEFNYRYASPGEAHIFVGFKLSEGAAETAGLIAQLVELGYPVTDLSHNEMAKMHVRYMVGGRLPAAGVGGRAPGLEDEQLFRFEFPERPGACLAFLDAVGSAFNISLFHYRNHGAAYGRVLAGLQVPRGKGRECREALDALGYPFWDERDNPAYALFLGSAAS